MGPLRWRRTWPIIFCMLLHAEDASLDLPNLAYFLLDVHQRSSASIARKRKKGSPWSRNPFPRLIQCSIFCFFQGSGRLGISNLDPGCKNIKTKKRHPSDPTCISFGPRRGWFRFVLESNTNVLSIQGWGYVRWLVYLGPTERTRATNVPSGGPRRGGDPSGTGTPGRLGVNPGDGLGTIFIWCCINVDVWWFPYNFTWFLMHFTWFNIIRNCLHYF